MVYIKYSFVFLLSISSIVLATVAEIETLLGFAFSNSSNWDNLINAFPTTGGSFNDVFVSLKSTLGNVKLM